MNKEFVKAALIRALRTFCQSFASFLTVGAVLSEIHWMEALSAAALAALYSVVNSIATGLPEV